MMLLKLVVFLFCSALPLYAKQPTLDPLRLDRAVEPFSQAVELRLDPSADGYSGTTLIELQFHMPTNRFRFHAKGIDLFQATLDGKTICLSPEANELVTATMAEMVPTGMHRLEMHFTNLYNMTGVGLYKGKSKDHTFLATQMEPTDARRAFPCWDEPDFKIPWRITVVAPPNLDVIGNMPVADVAQAVATQVVEFSRSPPMPSYLIFLGVGSFERVAVKGLSVPGNIFTHPGNAHLAQAIARESPRILSALEDYFGIPMPYPKLDQVALSEFNAGGMENAGAIAYKDARILMDPENAGFQQRRAMIGLVAHEMAHLWFGDLVTMRWWDDVWLNEAFATWMANRIASQLYPDLRFEYSRMGILQNARQNDQNPSVKPIRRPLRAKDNMEEAFDTLSYRKGGAILHMAENWLGTDQFREAMRLYFKRHLWVNARAEDLWKSFNEVRSGDLLEVMRRYVEQPGLPELTFARLPGDLCEIRQRRYQSVIASTLVSSPLWHVPVMIRYGSGQEVRQARFILTNEVGVFQAPELSQAQWMYPNIKEGGYYNWLLPADLRNAFSEPAVLCQLSSMERLGLLANARAAVVSGRMTELDRMALLLSMSNDIEPEIKVQVISELRQMAADYLTIADRPAFARLLHATLRPQLDRQGLEPDAAESPWFGPLRESLLIILGKYGQEPDLVDYCRRQTVHLLENPRQTEAGLADAILEVSAWHGEAPFLEQLQTALQQADAPDLLQRFLLTMCKFRNPDLNRKVLDYSLTSKVRGSEIVRMLLVMKNHPELAPWILDWTMSHYDDIKKKVPERVMARLPLLFDTADEAALSKGRAFFLDPIRRTPFVEVTMTQATEQAALRWELQKRHQSAIHQFLASW